MPNSSHLKVKSCFICSTDLSPQHSYINPKVNLYVCDNCKGTEEEKRKEREFLLDMGSGFTVGCI